MRQCLSVLGKNLFLQSIMSLQCNKIMADKASSAIQVFNSRNDWQDFQIDGVDLAATEITIIHKLR
jgi:hypothetical protein